MLNYKSYLLLFLSLILISCSDETVTGEYNSYDLIPTGLSASDGLYDSIIVIQWDEVENATAYNLKRTDNPVSGIFVVIASNVSDNEYTDKNITIGTKYYYKVNSVFSGPTDTSTFSSHDIGFAAIADDTTINDTTINDTTINDTTVNDTLIVPDFIILEAEDGVSDSLISLSWTNCGPDYNYVILGASFEDTSYTILDSSNSDTVFDHKNALPGPNRYKVLAVSPKNPDTLEATDEGYRKISNLEFFIEVNKTYKYSQAKIGKLVNEDLGKETVGGDHHGTLEYDSYMSGLNVKVNLTYENYKDFYLTLNGVQSTYIDGLFSKSGNVSDTVFAIGIYPGFVDHHIDVDGGDPSGGYYTVGQPGGDTSNIQFEDVKDEVLK